MCVWVASGSQSRTSSEEAGRNMSLLVDQWEAGAGGGGPFRKRLAEYQGCRPPTDLLSDKTDCSIFFYFVNHIFTLGWSRFPFIRPSFLLSACFLIRFFQASAFILISNLWSSPFSSPSVHLTVHPSFSVAPRGLKVCWYSAPCCRCHVHWCVRPIREEEVCTEYQAERQDVYSGTQEYHVSLNPVPLELFILCFLCPLVSHILSGHFMGVRRCHVGWFLSLSGFRYL